MYRTGETLKARRRPAAAMAGSMGLLLAIGHGGVSAAESHVDRTPVYTQDVSAVIDRNCLRCHRQGGAAGRVPFDTYEGLKDKLKEIRDKVATREMPPWPADPAHSLPMKNDPRLTSRDIATIVAWIDSGAPRGSGDPPPHPVFNGGWLQPDGLPPDVVVSLPKITVRANGTIPYIQRLIKVPYEHDKWISALQVRAANPALLHHMGITEVGLPEGMTPASLETMDSLSGQIGTQLQFQTVQVSDPTNPGAYDMLGVYTPGTSFENYGAGYGKLLKGGRNLYLNFNIHYTTTGREESDQTQLALWFSSEPPDRILYRAPAAVDAVIANGRELLTDDPGTKAEGTDYALPPILPNTANYELIGVSAYPSPITIFRLQPHAHVRAVDFQYVAVYPDGRQLQILTVPHYRYHFQLEYVLAKPLDLPAGTKLVVKAHYDNSSRNEHLRNLGANEAARKCGPQNVALFSRQNQSWDEMFSPLIQYAPENHADRLSVVSAVGCLSRESTGRWNLLHGSHWIPTQSQGTSSEEIASNAPRPLGNLQYALVGADFFGPARAAGSKVIVKGVLIPGQKIDRINVTSIQPAGSTCPN